MRAFIGGSTADILEMYLYNRNRMITQIQAGGTQGDLKTSTSSGADQRFALFAFGESQALEDPGFAKIWWMPGGLRSEVVDEGVTP